MIAKITRGSRPGDIGAYLHGAGKANEHQYYRNGKLHSGGVVIGGNLALWGSTTPEYWARDMRETIATRPDIKNPVWQVSLRNTANDRTLSDADWRDITQTFAEKMGFENHPWVVVRHGDDHVHLVVSRVDDLGQVWHGRNDRRQAQTACSELEEAYGLERAPRRRQNTRKRTFAAEVKAYRERAEDLATDRAEIANVIEIMRRSRPNGGSRTVTAKKSPGQSRGQKYQQEVQQQNRGYER